MHEKNWQNSLWRTEISNINDLSAHGRLPRVQKRFFHSRIWWKETFSPPFLFASLFRWSSILVDCSSVRYVLRCLPLYTCFYAMHLVLLIKFLILWVIDSSISKLSLREIVNPSLRTIQLKCLLVCYHNGQYRLTIIITYNDNSNNNLIFLNVTNFKNVNDDIWTFFV